MQKHRVKSPDAFDVRTKAGEILASRGNRLLLIEALIVFLIITPLYTTLYSAYDAICNGLQQSLTPIQQSAILWTYVALTAILTLFFILPLLLGLLRMSWEMENGLETSLIRLFSSFQDRKAYGRALALSFGAFWRVGLVVLTVWLTCMLTLRFFSRSLLAGLLCGLAVLAETVIGFLLCMRHFPTLAIAMYEQMSLKDARAIAKSMTKVCPFGGALFFFSFVPQIVLGLLTFGIFLIWEVLPRMCVSYFLYCKEMNEMIIRSEEYKKHE